MKMILAVASTLLIMAQTQQAFACGGAYGNKTPENDVSWHINDHFHNLKTRSYSPEKISAIWAKDARVVRLANGKVRQTRSVPAAIKIWSAPHSRFKSYTFKSLEVSRTSKSATVVVEVQWSNHKTRETFKLVPEQDGWRIERAQYTRLRSSD